MELKLKDNTRYTKCWSNKYRNKGKSLKAKKN